MNNSPSPLFNWPISRRDQETSQLAEEELNKSGKRETFMNKLIQCLKTYEGHTSNEIAKKFNLSPANTHKRLSDARHIKKVRNGDKKRCSVTGKVCMTWWMR